MSMTVEQYEALSISKEYLQGVDRTDYSKPAEAEYKLPLMSTTEARFKSPKLSKLRLRETLATSFKPLETRYDERNEGLTVTGTLTIGKASATLSCKRGGEVQMRLEVLRLADETHREVSSMVEAEKSK